MFSYLISKLGLKRFPNQLLLLAHTETCPEKPKQSGCVDSGSKTAPSNLKRALKSGNVRMGFIPDEWFLFFHSKTGVSGPYIFGLGLANYLLSKEIYVLEHEYYTALSVGPMLYYGSTRLGQDLARWLDKDIDEYVDTLEKGRKEEMDFYENIMKDAKDDQWRAEGQKLLMDAKKENIEMQLEAAYRERCMQVFRSVKGRLDYHVKLQRAKNRIHQKWMVDWIIENVKKSLTPEFEKQVLSKAIQDIAAISSRA